MKKLHLLASSLLLFSVTMGSQKLMGQSADSIRVDTIHYYFNKYYFKTGTPHQNFPLYKSPAATGTAITHVGVIFENTGTLDITGIEAFIHRHPKTSTSSLLPVNYGLYLCDLDANGKPKLPPIDSIRGGLMATQNSPNMFPVGGDFPNGPKTVTGKYAILFRNMSTKEGDTIYIKRTSGMTHTSSAAAIDKMSDSYGWARYGTNPPTFYSTTNFSVSGFGIGTDYEFCLAPRVQYTVQASQIRPTGDDTILCTQQRVNFTNTSSSKFRERMYNLIEFKTHWNHSPPFHPSTLQQYKFPDEESGIAWHIYAEDDVNFYLLPGNNTMTFSTDSAVVSDPENNPCQDTLNLFEANEFRVKLYGMNYMGGIRKFIYIEQFNLWTHYCNDCVGLADPNGLKKVAFYPNPTSGLLNISGLAGNVRVEVYNMTGQLMSSKMADITNTELDLSGLSKGNYLIRLSNGQSTKTLKILKN